MIQFRPAAKIDKDAVILMVNIEQVNRKNFALKNAAIQKLIIDVIKSKQFEGENGQLFPFIYKNKVVLLVGIGKIKELSLTALRITMKGAFLSSSLNQIRNVEVIFNEQRDDIINAVIESYLIGTYRWDRYKQRDKNDKTIKDKNLYLVTKPKKVYQDTMSICAGVSLTRDLINGNADEVTSSYFEKTIKEIIKGKKNFSLKVMNRKELKTAGLGLHLAVNQGSNKEPKLILVEYKGASKANPLTAFIGKGMTYDTGGINLKPSGHIETMRMDMSGAAAVVGTLKNVVALRPKKNILFVCGLAENAIGPDAYKPGDVISGYAKKSVEVANTDAEGRLVLADAISYVVKNYKPARLIDIATLTGACVVALGHDYTGIVSNDDKFARDIIRLSNATDDRAWRLPSYPELKDSVSSEIADIRNLGFPKGAGGTITAAEFLRQFTDDTKWAHLDIAGSAFVDGKSRWYFGYGATGAGVRLITQYLLNH